MSFGKFMKRGQDSQIKSALSSSLGRFVGRRSESRKRRRRQARRIFVEQLESRQLMALNILSISPADGATEVSVNSNLIINFNENVLKGQGNIYVIEHSTGTLGQVVDVTSSNVVVSGSQVTIDLPSDLSNDNTYDVFIDSGAFKDGSQVSTPGATLLTQNFDFLPLSPFVFETGGDGTDFTLAPPLGFSVDNAKMPTGGVPEWSGWSFADRDAWAQVDDQSRSEFTLASKTIAIADSDEWADTTPRGPGNFESIFVSKPINLSGVAANSVVLEFDSSFRPEDSQIGKLDVRFDSGEWVNLLTLNPTNTLNTAPSASIINKNINEHLTSGTNTGVSSNDPDFPTVPKGNIPFAAVQNPSSGTMEFRWGLVGGNDWWWGLDNIKVTGQITGVPFGGISNPTTWNFTTPDSLALSLAIDKTSMSENGGTAVGTVTRNRQFTDALTVTLANSDTSEASVPMTVTIPAGMPSVTFPITAVDDLLSDRTQVVKIDATAQAYAAAFATIEVLDDEGPKVVALTPTDNATAVDYRTNLLMTFDVPVKKGNGLINILRATDNVLVASIDVNSTAVPTQVTVSGNTVTINPPIDLPAPASYYVLMDDGTFLDTTTNVTANTILMTQNFDLLPLGPFVGGEVGGDGTDITRTPPLGYSISNSIASNTPPSNWFGWTFADPSAWAKGTAPRNQFTTGNGVIAVADPVRWGQAGSFNTLLTTAPINLTDVAANSVSLEFDSAYQGGIPQRARVDVSYNNGPWVDLAFLDGIGINNRIVINSTGVTVGCSLPIWERPDYRIPRRVTCNSDLHSKMAVPVRVLGRLIV